MKPIRVRTRGASAGAPASSTTRALGVSQAFGSTSGVPGTCRERKASARSRRAESFVMRRLNQLVGGEVWQESDRNVRHGSGTYGGYADDPAGVAETIRAVLALGAVGVNIEDALYEPGAGPLRPVPEQAERIAAARAAAHAVEVPLFVNARIDTFLRGAGGVEATLERAAAFLAAGADGIFVPGAVDPGTVKLLVDGIDAPVNVMAGPGAPTVSELASLGVARVSVGSAIAQAVHALVRRAARELLGAGTYGTLAGGADYGELNSLLGGAR
ncbi:isocitrate lyase/phosphoenolpyruvate mutase family protein [Streptomyces sp. NPDC057798]|uniref:isocitrate lyase/phosphoenolpyruvate mutase family protein n=1 Tax=Streptomyces sp. NPDC057798 TaxID=3346252 RepID=UPI0036CFD407